MENLILKLLITQKEVSVKSISQAGGYHPLTSSNRKRISRALNSLVKKSLITAKGSGRGRVYTLTDQSIFNQNPTDKTIPTNTKSTLIAYNQNFLRNYQPNKNFYLAETERQQLATIGRSDDQIHPAGTYARNILNRLLIDLSWNSSRLEGNTYSLLETKRLIELGEYASGKEVFETQMILNHKSAIEYIIESADSNDIGTHEICSIHALLSENLLGDPSASGRTRTIAVGIKGTRYIPIDNPHLLKECFELFIKKFNQIKDPFEQSIFALIHLSYLQLFEDVNKRTARITANVPLIKKNLKPLSFTEVNQDSYIKALFDIYEFNNFSPLKDLYIDAYTCSSQRYSAIQLGLGEPNLLKLKYRILIQQIVRLIIIEKTEGKKIVTKIRDLLQAEGIIGQVQKDLFEVIETEFLSLHEGNIARFRIRPSEYQDWKKLQG